MRATPTIIADTDEYPELRTVINVAVRRVSELMELHDIGELRRMRKSGIFEHPYTKDVVTPLNIPNIPASIAASRYSAGAALLDYLETIGITGIALELTQEDASAIAALWSPPKPEAPRANTEDDLDPSPVDEVEENTGATQTNPATEEEKDKAPEEAKTTTENRG